MEPVEEAHEVVADDVPVEASPPPTALVLTLGVPAFFVVLWFMVRLFSGRWITDPDPGPPTPQGPDLPGPGGTG